MSSVVRASGLGKRYGRRWALAECTVDIPAGRVVGLVGPNGAGKTTLLRLAVGQLTPTAGTIEVLGGRPGSDETQLARVGYVAQTAPVYAGLTVAEHLELGARLNPRWNSAVARQRVEQAGLDLRQRAGRLSGGQRAQLGLAMAVAKRPELLILDEPLSAVDPLARRGFFQGLMEAAADTGISVVLSSHVIGDVERICEHLVILVASQVRLAGDIDELRATHHLLIGPRDTLPPSGAAVVTARHADRQTTLLVRGERPADPQWTVTEPGLEDLVLAYMNTDMEAAS